MAATIENQYGKIIISEEVIATIAGLAAMECYGLVGMVPQRLSDGIVELLGREALSKGVKVHNDDGLLVIDVNAIVGYGTKISEVAQNIIDQVRYAVEKMTGLQVAKVNIHVKGVKLTAGK